MSETNNLAAALSIDSPEFRRLMWCFAHATGSVEHIGNLIAHIDAKLDQAHEDGFTAGFDSENPRATRWMNRAEKAEADCLVIQRAHSDANYAMNHWRVRAEAAEARALKAENQLRLFSAAVEALPRCTPSGRYCALMFQVPDGDYLKRSEVLALLQPQQPSDSSGLPR